MKYVVNGMHILEKEADRLLGETTITPAIAWAMASLLLEANAGKVDGLLDYAAMYATGFPGLDKSKRCVQVHFNDTNHFFTSTLDAVKEEVVLYDSLAMDLTWQAQHQLWLLYGQDEPEGQIRIRYAGR